MTVSGFFYGERVRLSPLNQLDAGIIARWQSDIEFLRLLDAQPSFPKSEQQVAEWIREGQRGRDNFLLGVRLLPDDELIGFLEIGEVLWTHRNSWLAIGIGAREHWGRGYGREAIELALDFVFQELNLHRIQLTVFSYNDRAVALYERLGFRREGVYREFLLRDGQHHDMYLYGLLAREWNGRRETIA